MWITHAQDDILPLWEKYVLPLGKKPYNQFVKATEQAAEHNRFAECFVWPQLYDGASYLAVDRRYMPGRNHHRAAGIARSRGDVGAFATFSLPHLVYFTNALRVGERDDCGKWSPPMGRVVAGRLYCFTYEFDQRGHEFLLTQLGWCRSSNNPLDSKIGQLYRHCNQYRDFCGITVNWSGHKSLHIHVVFDPSLVFTMTPQLDRNHEAAVRAGFEAHWLHLCGAVRAILDVPDHISSDPQLRFAEQYRRLPNGRRAVEATKRKPKGNGWIEVPFSHVLGIPAGTPLPQLTLWEKWRDDRAGGDALFFAPHPFAPAAQRAHHVNDGGLRPPKTPTPPKTQGHDLTPDEVDYCAGKLRDHFEAGTNNGYPKFSHLAHDGTHWCAHFFNGPEDRNPASVMRETYNRVLLAGGSQWHCVNLRLFEKTLLDQIKWWLFERRLKHRQTSVRSDMVAQVAPPARNLTPIETRFQQRAMSKAAARGMMPWVIKTALDMGDRVVIKTPEGCGKTSGLFESHHLIAARYGEERACAMYAFPCYDRAREKCDEFNRVQSANGFVGMILHGADREYAEACAEVGVQPISRDNALRQGYGDALRFARTHQPTVMRRLRERHRAFWDAIGGLRPVFFTAHQVMHHWHTRSMTATWWQPEDERIDIRRLYLAVHDEVTRDALLDCERADVLDWCYGWRKAMPQLWGMSAVDRYGAFCDYSQGSAPVSFQDADRIVRTSREAWREVTTGFSGEYTRVIPANGDHDIYMEACGKKWGVRPRRWWRNLAAKVVINTTEALPTELLRKLSDWQIVELETPLIPCDALDVHLDRYAAASNTAQTIALYRKTIGDHWVIANNAATIERTVTHASARGTNDLIGKDVMQVIHHMPPALYEQMEVLNAWLGRAVACGLHHVDEINQSAGRNLGFRQSGACRNHLLTTYELWLKLFEVAAQHLRYLPRGHLSPSRQWRLTR